MSQPRNQLTSFFEPRAPHSPGRLIVVHPESHRRDPTLDTDLIETDVTIEFGRFRLIPRQRQLLADGRPIKLHSRAFDLLLVLLEADGRCVSKQELMSRVWPDIAVVDKNLDVQICALRKALGDDRHFIRTDVGRGYRFTAAIRSVADSPRSRESPPNTAKRVDGGDQLIEVLNRIAALLASNETARANFALEIVVRLVPVNSGEDASPPRITLPAKPAP